jgi:YYY domain-containing protein
MGHKCKLFYRDLSFTTPCGLSDEHAPPLGQWEYMQQEKRSWIYDIILVAVLALAAYLRVTGVDWGEGQHQHPDELFLTGVTENLRAHVCMDEGMLIDACPSDRQRWMNPLEYFDTTTSTLNPNNRGAGFYVYGNLPLTLVRVTYEMIGTDAGPLKYFGRRFSALADLFTILILYFIVARLYSRRTALLAAAFSALAVMQIQQSHYYTVDLFMNPFMYLALYFAVRIAYDRPVHTDTTTQVDKYIGIPVDTDDNEVASPASSSSFILHLSFFLRDPLFWNSIFFGLALGMAAACKINAVVLAIMLPVALALRLGRESCEVVDDPKLATNVACSPLANEPWIRFAISVVLGATIIFFRIFQPYAFNGLLPNPQWIDSMKEIRAQATGLADLPWNLQWVRRTHLYSFTNLTVWGLGLPLGILAWTGFLYMAWCIFKKGERQHILLWLWTALYFGWQSLQFNATMRYQLPIYPLLAMMAAWGVFWVADSKFRVERNFEHVERSFRFIAFLVGGIVLALTAVWAFAFLSVYTRPETRVAASRWIYQNVPGPITLHFDDGASQPLSLPIGTSVSNGTPYLAAFTARTDGALTEILLPHVVANPASLQTLSLSLLNQPDSTSALASDSISSDFSALNDPRGQSFTLAFDQPVPLVKGQTYFLRVETTGAVTLAGATIANETDYDWTLPFRIDGYDAFGGMYGDLNLQVYWDDNADKLARFQDILNHTDYIFVPTNHQYAQIPRVPERYPLTTVYYRELIGCPPDEDIIRCYRIAEPGTFEGRLGFELVQVIESYPTLGPLVINDGAAEEAFTFYDHPKVLVFKKSMGYDATKVATTLGVVDLTKVIHLAPKDVNGYKPPKSLMLPADRLAGQQAGGTWSQLFDYAWLQNKYPALGVVFWYEFIFLLGLFTYPLARRVLPGLADKGYALSRTLGLVILAYFPWLMGSLGIPYSRANIGIVFGAILLVGAWQAWVQREALAFEWRSNRRAFLIVEGIFLTLFLLDLLIRLGNPDLWHPSKGGERPMDFSYFNAVLKSTTFPPYDPWFAGGYINYYYYGYVLVGTPVKLLGIVPSIAYNFILPTLFALVGIGAFSIGSNLVRRNTHHASLITDYWSLITGLASTFLMLLLGNLGTIQMLWRTFQRTGAPDGMTDGANIFQRFMWALDGMAKSLAGAPLPGPGEWYWNPSRVISPSPGNEITEFPLFTFLYSDLHAHMIVLMLALFVIAWGLSFILALRSARQESRPSFSSLITEHWPLITFPIILGALVLGAIYPTNTWDAFTYMPLAAIAVGYALFNAVDFKENRFKFSPFLLRVAFSIAGALTLVALARLFYQPYFQWFGSGYGKVDAWNSEHTPLSAYFTHWGVFLFLIFAWMVWETREWMASTPLSSLNKLRPYTLAIEISIAAFIVLLIYLIYKQAYIGLVALPLAFWAAILILRPGQSDAKRWVLFMVGTALALTIAVELIVLVGDIGRMNTIFKLYLQAWTMLSVSAASAFGWTLPAVTSWRMRWRSVWQVGLTLLLAGAALFSITATFDKVRDRMNPDVPHTLDSMTYMETSQFWDATTMELSQDYHAIRWMQDNVQGSPVIIEGNCVEYRWCTRFTIYTGLPGVLGWNWHQRQQRGFVEPLIVENRLAEITAFYTTTDIPAAQAFLVKYNVRYIVVGQVENIYYPGEGLLKFERYDGLFWTEVFRDGQTVVYEVNR